MGLGKFDLELLLEHRKKYPFGNKCAILGNCTFWFDKGSNEDQKEKFKQLMKFDTVDTFDINGEPTYKLDLQEQLPEELFDKYDWVIDVGTLFCIFDIASAWKNMFYMAKQECCIIHFTSLVGNFGRGFYNLSPSVLNELYDTNGFNKKIYYTIKAGSHKHEWTPIKDNCNYLKATSESHFQFVNFNTSVRYCIPCDSELACMTYSNNNTHILQNVVPQHYIDSQGK